MKTNPQDFSCATFENSDDWVVRSVLRAIPSVMIGPSLTYSTYSSPSSLSMSFITRFPRASALAASRRSYATATSVVDAAGVKVAGIEKGAPAGTVNLTVVVKAGSRYETTPGVAHALKNFAFKVGESFWVEYVGKLTTRQHPKDLP